MSRVEPSRSLALVMTIGMFTACGQHPAPSKVVPSDIEEARADIAAIKNNPSLTDPSKAGPPIHVDPYPKSAGMRGGHGHAGMGMK